MTTEPQTVLDQGWIFRIRKGQPDKHPVPLLLLHGWTGDETSMWIFAQHLPAAVPILAPRAPLPAAPSGYSWAKVTQGVRSRMEDFLPAAAQMLAHFDRHLSELGLSNQQFDWMGFSQGCALGYVLSALAPARIRRAAALSGFMPAGVEPAMPEDALAGSHFFVAHGSLDEIIPIESARQSAAALQAKGAKVTYCESPVGHKLSSGCFQGLEEFLSA